MAIDVAASVNLQDDVIGSMRQQRVTSESKGSGSYFWFRLGDKQKALIRPLVNLNGCDKLLFHHFFDQNAKRYVDAVCASVNGEPCHYCEMGKMAETKRLKADLTPKEIFIVPLWLHAIMAKQVDESGMEILDGNDNPVWGKMTYKDQETQEDKIVCGLRFIRLSFQDATKGVLDAFLKLYEAGGDLRAQDIVVERQGGDQHTKYVPSKRQPSPFSATDEKFTRAIIRARVLEAAPPVVSDTQPSPATDRIKEVMSNTDQAAGQNDAPEF